MRGKVTVNADGTITHGITPAYAGKREIRETDAKIDQDHPRLCGEKKVVRSEWNNHTGSPPPMRGKEEWLDQFGMMSGITPAYAGKSSGRYAQLRLHQDHPRLCGEKTKKIPKQRYFFHQPASFSFSLQYT